MTIQELLETTILLEHIKQGGKKSCGQVNKVYSYLPEPKNHKATKKQKIRLIDEYWGKLGDEVIKKYLIDKQTQEFSGNTETPSEYKQILKPFTNDIQENK